jgi:predicted ATPase/signal transduction histidine kinase
MERRMFTKSGSKLPEILLDAGDTVMLRSTRGETSVLLRTSSKEYPSSEERAKLRYGAEITAGLDPAMVLRVLAVEDGADRLVVVLEDFGGVPLRQIMNGGKSSTEQALHFAIGISRAIGEIHGHGIVHRGIEPGSVFVDTRSRTVKVTGFDRASRLTQEARAVAGPRAPQGSLLYTSPEQTGRMNRAVDYRTDFYSLGVVLYELLSGLTPFRGADPAALVHAQIAVEPRPLHEIVPGLPERLAAVVGKLLAKNADDRYQSAYGLTADLQACLGSVRGGATLDGFVPGERDVSAVFRIPQRLYGREAEVAQLEGALDRVAAGAAELVLVSGYSGVGKSALVNELQRGVVAKRGYFSSGKFDALRNTPHGGLIQAFRRLIQQILAESDDRVGSFRDALRDSFGAGGQVVVEVIPEVELIIGPQPPVPPLGPSETQNRFNLFFQRFVDVLATVGHPITLFLDDLQWADSASLALIQLLLQNPGGRVLLLIGAYRDNEVHATHPLSAALAEARRSPAIIHEISLRPLGLPDVTRMVAETFGRGDDAETRELGGLVHQKTQGNPFFVNQFLGSLHAGGLVTFDPAGGRWGWDRARIEATGITDNVAVLMAGRLERLAGPTRAALELAACVGNRFDASTLAVIQGQPAQRTAADLWEAVQEGLIVPIGDAYKYLPAGDAEPWSGSRVEYEFLHDRVREAAYALVSGASRSAVHLRVGRLLLEATPRDTRDAAIFQIVDHLDHGLSLVDDPRERIEIARLNLTAGHRAKTSTAYEAAVRYLDAGIGLLPAGCWQSERALAFQLHRERAECDYHLGRLEAAQQSFERMLAEDLTSEEQLEIHRIRMALFATLGLFTESMNAGDAALRVLGIEIPTTVEGLMAAAGPEMGGVQARLAQGLDGLAEAPEVEDPLERKRHEVLREAFLYVSYQVPPRFQLLALMLAHRSFQHGVSPASACAYLPLGSMLGFMTGSYAIGHQLGQIAIRLGERFGDLDLRGTAAFGYGGYLSPWTRPLRESYLHLERGYTWLLEAGSLHYAGSTLLMTIWVRFMAGDNLAELFERSRTYVDARRYTNNKDLAAFIGLFQRVMLLLMKGRIPEDLAAALGEDTLKKQLAHYGAAVNMGDVLGLEVAYLQGDHETALAASERARPGLMANFSHVTEVEFVFFDALLRAALATTGPAEGRDAHLATVGEAREKLRRWAEGCPENFTYKHALVAAEAARVAGQDQEAMELYDRAIESAAENGYPHGQALAAELATAFHLARGRRLIARAYLADARYAYARWGADARVVALDAKYGDLVVRAGAAGGAAAATPLDLLAVMKASQAISGEIVLGDLLRQLMRTVLESAGARRGSLLLQGEGDLIVNAREAGDEGVVVEIASAPLESRADLARGIVRYVERTRETVVLGDAGNEPRFQADPYIAAARPKSVLCTPILRQKKLVGVLYLENDLTTFAFTPERCKLLELLSAQAAISLENARLYDTLDHRVKERTRELDESNQELSRALARLKETQRQLVLQEKLASLGTLTAGIAHEIKNPLNFVNNFADLSIDLTGELGDALRGRGADPDADAQAEVDETLAALRQNLTKIRDHGRRADGIINGMLQHARDSSSQREDADLNALVTECVEFVCASARAKDPAFDVRVDAELDPSLGLVSMAPRDMSRVFVNVLDNACYATRQKQRRRSPGYAPRVVIRTRDLGDRVEVSFRDNGVGIRADVVDRIFNPFFTTKPAGEGTGLGLSISHDVVVEEHRGEMKVHTAVDEFTDFVITLPKQAAPAAPEPHA